MKNTIFFLAGIFVNFSALSQTKPEQIKDLVRPSQNIPKKVIKSTREFREHLLADPYRPA